MCGVDRVLYVQYSQLPICSTYMVENSPSSQDYFLVRIRLVHLPIILEFNTLSSYLVVRIFVAQQDAPGEGGDEDRKVRAVGVGLVKGLFGNNIKLQEKEKGISRWCVQL